ncbi:MAG TPA: hypothetical protein VFB62_20780 [Polyangiaceae bacterium]|jgi:hypothetical protein|nr:hypothetical protein [Polyangiaceae bacterium]
MVEKGPGSERSEPGWDEEPTHVRDEQAEAPADPPFRVEHTVRMRPDQIDRRALPFRKDARGRRRADDVVIQTHTDAVRPDELRSALPFQAPEPAVTHTPLAHQEPSVWSREAAIDPRDLPSSLAPTQLSNLPASVIPEPHDASRAVAALVIVSIAVLVGLVALALFVLR